MAITAQPPHLSPPTSVVVEVPPLHPLVEHASPISAQLAGCRVAVVSHSALIRAGVTGIIAQLHGPLVVTAATPAVRWLVPHDVVIRDLTGSDHHLIEWPASENRHIGIVDDSTRVVDSSDPLLRPICVSATLEDVRRALVWAMSDDVRSIPPTPALPAGLSKRELAILELIGAGRSNEAIADDLFLSINSIKTYIRSAYRKIGVGNRSGAMLWAFEHGMAGRPDPPHRI